MVGEDDRKKRVSLIGLIVCSSVLIVFKALSFNLKFLNIIPGVTIDYHPITIPLGLAYYSLVVIAYLTDIYQSKVAAEQNFIKYFLHTGNFLRIFQGPITCYSNEISEKVISCQTTKYDDVAHGAQLVLWGLFKKLVIADWLSDPVGKVFASDKMAGSIYLFGSILYYIQLYCDFSGCVDMVTGYSEMLGITIPKNFAHPFFSVSVTDFWRRWHITLSSWLKDYIYIPLGGNRKGKIRNYLNILIVFLISGFWHGSGLKFIIWGMIHALIQIIEKAVRQKGWIKKKSNNPALRIVINFFVISLTWIPFRAKGVSNAFHIYQKIALNFDFPSLVQKLYTFGLSKEQSSAVFIAIILLFAVEFLQEFYKVSFRKKIDEMSLIMRWIIFVVFICLIVTFGHYGPNFAAGTFIYEQF